VITKDSIETAYSFLHQKQRIYAHSTLDWQKDDIEVAIASYADDMSRELYTTISGGNLTAALFANDIFRNLRERWTGYYPVTTMTKDAYLYTQNIGVSLSYNFNTTRSKYKGTGAGNEEKNRL
jgi:hypothetical protein